MTKAEIYRNRAIEFLALADEASDPEEREALRTFACCCFQLSERAEKYWEQRHNTSQPEVGDESARLSYILSARADQGPPTTPRVSPGRCEDSPDSSVSQLETP